LSPPWFFGTSSLICRSPDFFFPLPRFS
jgi:hypothetical protein